MTGDTPSGTAAYDGVAVGKVAPTTRRYTSTMEK